MYICMYGCEGCGEHGASKCRISQSVSSVGYRLPTYLPTSLYLWHIRSMNRASATRGFFF